MKQKLRLMMTMLLLAVMGSAWAVTATFEPSNFSDQGTSGTGSAISATVEGVTFTCNKGFGTTQIRCYSGSKIIISSSNTITAINFTFSGSYTGGLETSYTELSTTSWEKTLSGQARITKIEVTSGSATYRVTYDVNGGEGNVPVDENNYENGAKVTVLGGNGLSRIGYSYAGWNTSYDGTGLSYSEGSTFNITANTILYANWIVNTYNVTLPSSDTYGAYTMNATNPVAYGTSVSLSYSPASGYENYSATWSINGIPIVGNSFVMPNEDVEVTVSVKKVTTTSMMVDFENEASTYTDWIFSNMQSQQTHANVSPHGDYYIGSTGGFATAYIQTLEQVNPVSLISYVSKQSSNTASSTWYVQVSSDGNTWEDVKVQSATDMAQGTWKELSADLSNYSNVYVRIYYKGSTAVRNIDDVTLIVNGSSVSKVSTPEFSLAEGTYRGEQSVTISCATPNAVIYYTTDGTEPTINSTQYSGAIPVSETTTIKAIATYGEMDNSDVATATYTIKEPLSGDVFVKATSESDLEDGFEIIIVNDTYSKVMGEQRENNFGAVSIDIDKSVNPYEAALEDDATTILTLEGQAGEWYFKDEEGYYLYTASTSSNALHTKNNKDNYTKATISFSGDNSDAVITFQGITTRNILRYNNGNNALFSCYSSGQDPVQIYYRAPQQTIAKPTVTPASGTYEEPQTVTITNNAEGTTVYYTIDGTTPTIASSKYTNSFQLGKNGTYVVKAISIGADGSSRVTTNTITIDIHVDAPVFTETDGTTFSEPYTIHLTSAQGTTIYYTTRAASPIDENGNLSADAKVYNASTGIANLTNAVTINAVAIDNGGNVSVVSTAKYKYVGEVTLPYYENFDEGLGNFVTESEGEVMWEFQTNHDVATYGEERKYAYISGGTYNTMASNVGEDRLISPVLDLTDYETVSMNFVHAGHWFGSSSNGVDTDNSETVKKASCHLQVRKVGDSEWTEISIPTWFVQKRENNKNMYERINSGDIDLSAYKGQQIQVCFYFTTTSSTSGTWNVLKFAVTGTEKEEDPVIYETVNMKTDGYITYVVKNDIDWDATMKMNNNVYSYKVIQFTEATNGGTTVLVELGNDEEMAVDETKLEEALTTEQKKPLWSEKIIPAGTPIILKGKAGDNLLVIAKSDDVIPSVKGNLLKPSFGDVQGSGAQTLYVLQKSPEWVATNPYDNYMFYKLANGRTIPERKAYLNGTDASDKIIYYLTNNPGADQPGPGGPGGAKANFVILAHAEAEDMVSEDAGLVDGINEVNGGNRMNDNEYYSISGVKVSNPSKGIYILNGKKVIVK